MAEPTEEPVPSSRWLAKWVREERFWQDIATRTLSTLVVLAMGYLYAVLVGYVREPGSGRAWSSLVIVVVIVVAIIAFVAYCIKLWAKDTRGGTMPSRAAVVLMAPIFAVVIAALTMIAFWVEKSIWGP